MADKTLKSITFPGLPDRYVVPDYSVDIAEIKEDLNDVFYDGVPTLVSGWSTGYIATNGDTVNISSVIRNAAFEHVVIDVSAGDRYYVHQVGDSSVARSYCFIDSSANSLAVSSGNSAIDEIVTAPENAVKLVLNNNKVDNNGYVYRVNAVLEELQEHEDEITLLQTNPIFKTGETYNLVDYVDMLYEKAYWHGTTVENGRYTYNTTLHTIVGVLPVEPGQIVTSSRHVQKIDFFDVDKTYISSVASSSKSDVYEALLVPDSAHYMKPQWYSYENIGENGVKTGELADIYVVPKYGAQSVRHALKPKTQINGRYVSDDIFDVATPAELSRFDLISRCREIKRQNRERGAVRLATFNIYGAMIKYVNWPVVKAECTQYGLDACGFQEVADSKKWDDGTTNRYSFSRSMMGEVFKYSNLGTTDPDGQGVRILSGLEMESGEYVSFEYEYTVSNTTFTATAGYSHAIINLPNYHHARDWDKQISMYTCHLSTAASMARGVLEYLANVIAADTCEYKVFVADTNCFSLDDTTHEPWCWSYFKNMGLYPAATDFTKSSICYPVAQEDWSANNLDFIDNIFCTDNMQCINWGVVDSQDYPITGVSGGYVSDHCMLYADMIFDFVDGFSGT